MTSSLWWQVFCRSVSVKGINWGKLKSCDMCLLLLLFFSIYDYPQLSPVATAVTVQQKLHRLVLKIGLYISKYDNLSYLQRLKVPLN